MPVSRRSCRAAPPAARGVPWRCSALLRRLALASGRAITDIAEDNIYADEVILARDTPYQRIVADPVEGRPAPVPELASAVQLARRVSLSRSAGASRAAAVAGAAPRAGARRRRRPRRSRDAEVPEVERIMLVDLDPEMTRLFSTNPLLVATECRFAQLAEGAGRQRGRVPLARFSNGHVRLRRRRFSRSDQLLARQALHHRVLPALGASPAAIGAFVVQSTSPMFARKSFWCIDET